MSTNLPATEAPPTFVRAMSEAAEAAIRQGIPCDEATARAAFAIEAEYQAAGLPTPLTPLTAARDAYRAEWHREEPPHE